MSTPDQASDGVRRYFDRSAARFDLIYQNDKSVVQRLVDRLFRAVIWHRFQLTLERCGNVAGKRVLDVGCGSGRYSVELARRGAAVVGLDFATGMVELAAAAASAAGVAERCRFEQADFLAWGESRPFDIGLAIGYFDYIRTPQPHVDRLAAHVRGPVFCSFPVRWTCRTPSRWLRLRLNGCPVHFYGRGQVNSLFGGAVWTSCDVHRLSRDYLVEARTA